MSSEDDEHLDSFLSGGGRMRYATMKNATMDVHEFLASQTLPSTIQFSMDDETQETHTTASDEDTNTYGTMVQNDTDSTTDPTRTHPQPPPATWGGDSFATMVLTGSDNAATDPTHAAKPTKNAWSTLVLDDDEGYGTIVVEAVPERGSTDPTKNVQRQCTDPTRNVQRKSDSGSKPKRLSTKYELGGTLRFDGRTLESPHASRKKKATIRRQLRNQTLKASQIDMDAAKMSALTDLVADKDKELQKMRELVAKLREGTAADMCSSCGATLAPDSQFCAQCGAKQIKGNARVSALEADNTKLRSQAALLEAENKILREKVVNLATAVADQALEIKDLKVLVSSMSSARSTNKQRINTDKGRGNTTMQGSRVSCDCGATMPSKARFCIECGKAAKATRQCSQCQRECPGIAKFCIGCGTAF